MTIETQSVARTTEVAESKIETGTSTLSIGLETRQSMEKVADLLTLVIGESDNSQVIFLLPKTQDELSMDGYENLSDPKDKKEFVKRSASKSLDLIKANLFKILKKSRHVQATVEQEGDIKKLEILKKSVRVHQMFEPEFQEFYKTVITTMHPRKLEEAENNNKSIGLITVFDALGQINNPVGIFPNTKSDIEDMKPVNEEYVEIVDSNDYPEQTLTIKEINVPLRKCISYIRGIFCLYGLYQNQYNDSVDNRDYFQKEKLYILTLFLPRIIYLIDKYKDYFSPDSKDPNSYINKLNKLGFNEGGEDSISVKMSNFLKNQWVPIVEIAEQFEMKKLERFLLTDIDEKFTKES